MLQRSALLVLSLVLGFAGIARADDLDTLRTMLGIASLPNAQERDEYVGTLPKGMLLIPQPEGLVLLGSTAASNDGKLTSETIFYAAQAGSVPDLASYQQQLGSQGWSVWSPPGMPTLPFALPSTASTSRTFCKTGNPSVTVRLDHQYLVVSALAGGGICNSPLARRTLPGISKAPYPVFNPPDGAIFVGSSKQTFNGTAHVASISVVSTASPSVLLASLAKQMTGAGWKAKTQPAPDGDSQAFTIRDADGVDWIAALSVVQVGSGMYLFTASAFKISETTNGSVSVR